MKTDLLLASLLASVCLLVACGGASVSSSVPPPLVSAPMSDPAPSESAGIDEPSVDEVDPLARLRIELPSVSDSLSGLSRSLRRGEELWVVIRPGARVTVGVGSRHSVVVTTIHAFAARIEPAPGPYDRVRFAFSATGVATLPHGCAKEAPVWSDVPAEFIASVSSTDLMTVLSRGGVVPGANNDGVLLARGTPLVVVDGLVRVPDPRLAALLDAETQAHLRIEYGFTCASSDCNRQGDEVCERDVEMATIDFGAGVSEYGGSSSEVGGIGLLGAASDEPAAMGTLGMGGTGTIGGSRRTAARPRTTTLEFGAALTDEDGVPFGRLLDAYEVPTPRDHRPGGRRCFPVEMSASFLEDEVMFAACTSDEAP